MPQYTTNFVKNQKGNTIKIGSTLKIKVTGADVVTARIKDSSGNLMDIAQSHKADKDQNIETVEINLYSRRLGVKTNYPLGNYDLLVWFWKGQKGGSYKERFDII